MTRYPTPIFLLTLGLAVAHGGGRQTPADTSPREGPEAAAAAVKRAQNVATFKAAMKKREQNIIGWTAFSAQFIDPPCFQLLPRPQAAQYRATVKQGGKTLAVSSERPFLSLKGVWGRIHLGRFDLTLEWLDAQGKVIESEFSARVKAPDWQGLRGSMEDWAASADRNVAWLLDEAKNGVTAYREPGMPVWFWNASARPRDKEPKGSIAFPSLHMPLFIRAFAACSEASRPNAAEARRMAALCGDWLLKNRRPSGRALPLFPYSTIAAGKFTGSGIEADTANLLRASFMAHGLVILYELTKNEDLLDYACHIADETMKFQAPDGSFPYRVDTNTGRAVDAFTCHAAEFVALVDALAPHRYDAARERSARRAADWLFAYVRQTSHWQAGFEDVATTIPFQNLESWSPLIFIRHLCRHKDEDPAFLPAAEELERWVEDQFAAFGPDEAIPVLSPAPLIMEQYACFLPMEVHTGNWILALIELHKATGRREYLDKARAAGNAIVQSQFEDGQFSTAGRDVRTGKNAGDSENWYGCNAWADESLYKLDGYVKALKKRDGKQSLEGTSWGKGPSA